MAQRFPIRSENKPFTPDSRLEFLDWLPTVGPTGNRLVIDTLVVRVTGTITVAGAAMGGVDLPRLFANINVENRSGRVRWSLSGWETRLMARHLMGSDWYVEHAELSVGAARTVDLSIPVPFTKRYGKRGRDFALPVDVFRRLSLQCASLSAAATTGVTLSAASLQVYCVAECHEEDSIEIKSEDEIKAAAFSTAEQTRLVTHGLVQDLLIYKPGATGGGESITGISSVRIDDLGLPPMDRADLVNQYTRARLVGNNAYGDGGTAGGERVLDDTRNGRVLPVIFSDGYSSVRDGKFAATMNLNVTGGSSGQYALVREIVPHDQAVFASVADFWGIDAGAVAPRVKTAGKQKRKISDWSERDRQVMPISFPMMKRPR